MLAHYPAATAGERAIRLAIAALQGMRQLASVFRLQLQGGALPARAARACALLTAVALLPGCILKQDLPDPAFEQGLWTVLHRRKNAAFAQRFGWLWRFGEHSTVFPQVSVE